MIATIVRIGILRLRNNPLEVALMFLVPIIFFSIFAMIFGRGIGSGKASPIKVVFVNQDRTEAANTLIAELSNESALENVADEDQGESADHSLATVTREEALSRVRAGKATLAIVFPQHLGDALRNSSALKIEILADTSDQIATRVVSAMVRQVVFAHRGRLASQRGRLASQRGRLASQRGGTRGAELNGFDIPVAAEPAPDILAIRDVLATEKSNPRISMYAAGIAVMFLLFSASGAGGTLLEEQEAGTLERLLSSQLTLNQLLAGKWIFITVCGSLQLLVMFVWAQVVFRVDLVGHLPGFALMAISTAAAAASLALLLATLCRSRSQLNGVSVILILTMSALGGSMVPRYIMSEELQQYGLLTFNAWALDGFDKVFWRDLSVVELQPQIFVLLASAAAMAVAARMCARRWEA
jgi:ABC-2 type transport system permease protein